MKIISKTVSMSQWC